MAKNQHKTGRRLTVGMVIVLLLTLCLGITTFALSYATVQVENNLFQTGMIQINLNDGKPIIEEHEFLFEPGMTVKKDFFIENESTWDVYYKIYLNNVQGGLADVLQITICDGDTVLCSGKASELNRENTLAVDDTLKIKERRVLTAYFSFAPDAGNAAQDRAMTFELCADAVQTKNNPNKLFD